MTQLDPEERLLQRLVGPVRFRELKADYKKAEAKLSKWEQTEWPKSGLFYASFNGELRAFLVGPGTGPVSVVIRTAEMSLPQKSHILDKWVPIHWAQATVLLLSSLLKGHFCVHRER